MAAPTGVNEELPGEPAKAGRTGAELAEPQAAEAETSEPETSEPETSETETSDTRTAEAGTTEAAPVQAVEEAKEKAAPAGPIPAEVVPPQAGPAGEERVPAGPADATSAGAETVETEPAEETGDWDAEEVRRDVSPLAVVGIILGVIALVGVAAGVLFVVTHGFRPKTVVTVTYRPAAVFGLRPGQCVNSGSDALNATVVSCARPHDAEVFAVFTLPAAPWPGASAVRVDADNGCASRFGGYIDPQLTTASLTQEFVYPNKVAWQAGQRTVVCEVSATDGRLTGSVRANG
jgi:hypothetical protein